MTDGITDVSAPVPVLARPLVKVLGNGLLFNISWLVIVLSESAAIALAQSAVHLALHFFWLGRGASELRLVAALFAGGWLLDQALFASGVFTLAGEASRAPLWISCLWPVFATTLCHAFAGLQTRPMLAGVLGACSGSASYVAGVRLTQVDFGEPLWSPLLLAILWGGLFPSLLWVARQTVPARDA